MQFYERGLCRRGEVLEGHFLPEGNDPRLLGWRTLQIRHQLILAVTKRVRHRCLKERVVSMLVEILEVELVESR